jgi:DNA-binding transcriptional ArsR family regulator
MTTDVHKLIEDATAKLKSEAEWLRKAIGAKEQALRDELGPVRAQLAELDEAIARIEGTTIQPAPSGSSSRAPRGHNRNLILNYLAGHEDASAKDITEGTQITSTTVFATLAKLTQDGLVDKNTDGDRVTHALTATGKEQAQAGSDT